MKKTMYIKPNVRVMAIDNTEPLAASPGSVSDDNNNSGDEGDAKRYQFIEDDEPTSGSRSPWDN